MELQTNDVVFLDTETTGLGYLPDTDFLEVALVDQEGKVLLNTLCDPQIECEAGALAIHGITPEMLVDQPKSSEIRAQVLELCKGKTVVIYNAQYDTRFFPAIYEVAEKVLCCMERFAEKYGAWNDYHCSYTWQKLIVAARYTGYKWQGDSHRALADTLATMHIWNWLNNPVEIEEIEEEIEDCEYELSDCSIPF